MDIIWTKRTLETFIEEGCLSDIDEKITRLMAKGKSREEIAYEASMSISAVDKHKKIIGAKFEKVSKYIDL